MSEFIYFATPDGYIFVHYTKIKVVKDGAIYAYLGDGVMLPMDDQEASDLMLKLEKLSNSNRGRKV